MLKRKVVSEDRIIHTQHLQPYRTITLVSRLVDVLIDI